MTFFIGHGILEPCCFEMHISKPRPLELIIGDLPIPDSTRDGIIAVRENQSLRNEDVIFPEDTIHLYFVICGG